MDAYYAIQEYRKAFANQQRALDESGEPHELTSWLLKQAETLESQIKATLNAYTDNTDIGSWTKSITGIGPVIAAGLATHIDVTVAKHVGNVWSFAGLSPNAVWEKGQKRPWNASLKTLCWKIGESFVKVKGKDSDLYGKIYEQRKELEIRRNENGEYAGQAKAKLEKFKIGKTTEAYAHYSAGRLPPGHIHARAKRYAVKLFLSHYFEKAYEFKHGVKPPRPYAFTQLGHDSYIEPPQPNIK